MLSLCFQSCLFVHDGRLHTLKSTKAQEFLSWDPETEPETGFVESFGRVSIFYLLQSDMNVISSL